MDIGRDPPGRFWLDGCMKIASQFAETGVAKDQHVREDVTALVQS